MGIQGCTRRARSRAYGLVMAIITLAEAKILMGLRADDTSKDAIISLAIGEVEADYLRIRNAAFETDDLGAVLYPPGSKLIAADMLAWVLVTRGSVGIVSRAIESVHETLVSGKDLIQGYPRSIVERITRYVGAHN